MSASILYLLVCVFDIMNKAGMSDKKSILCHEPTSYCSLLEKGKSAWLYDDELKFEAK